MKRILTFGDFAELIGCDLLDLDPDAETLDDLRDEPLYRCSFVDDYITDGTLSADLTTVFTN